MKPIILHAAAEAELRETLAYYESQRIGLGGEFLRGFVAAIQRVRANPQAYALEDDRGARYCPLRRFPFNLIYVELEDRIWIAALAHQRRRPGYWTARKQD